LPAGHKRFNVHPFQGVDQLLQLRRKSFDFLAQIRDEFRLNHVPALQRSCALRSIPLGRPMGVWIIRIMPAMAVPISSSNRIIRSKAVSCNYLIM
jgi:hypothetical protein